VLPEPAGAQLFAATLTADQVHALGAALSRWDLARAGTRIPDVRAMEFWIAPCGQIGSIAAHVLGPTAKPVRAILFDKNPDNNWSLGWHQDRIIAVDSRENVDGLVFWTVKDGVHHVEPPFALIERMVTLRIHLDPAAADNAPLLVSPGTHRLGKLTDAEIEPAVHRHGTETCLAAAGDVWAYRTPLLHASQPSTAAARRRVLQLNYSADDLPAPLRWALAA
jgi:hypothetical protein